jgi:hypothetical protein
MWMVVVGAIVYTLRQFRLARVALSMGIAAYAAMVYIYIFAMPAAEAYRGEKPFGYAIRDRIGEHTAQLGLFRTVGPLFYIDPPKPLAEFDRPKDLASVIDDGKIKWVIVRRRDLPAMGLATEVLAEEASFPWESEYDHRNKLVLVTVGTR